MQKKYFYPRTFTLPVLFSSAVLATERHLEKPVLNSLDTTEITRRKLLHNSCINSYASTAQILTQVLTAFNEAAEEYKTGLNQLMDFIDRYTQISQHTAHGTNEQIEDEIIRWRNVAQEKKKSYYEFVSMIEYIEKLVVAVAEVSFLFGAEDVSSLVTEQWNSIHQKMKEEQREVRKKEQDTLISESTFAKHFGKTY